MNVMFIFSITYCESNVLQEMIMYQRLSTMALPKGLYLGYLKLRSSVDLIHIMVPKALPNILPFVKIRDCSNVAKYVCG